MTAQYEIEKFCISKDATIRQVMAVIDKNKEGIALVIDEDRKLIGTITDGDIRRFLLAQRSMEESASAIMYTAPMTAPLESSEKDVRALLQKYRLRSIPMVDTNGRPRRLMTFRDLLQDDRDEITAVIMAGGEGKRLRPLTEQVPKPMLRVGDRPVLENIILSLADAEVKKIYIAVNYMAEAIESYFKDGSKWGVKIHYLREKEKLGTAGALNLLPEIPSQPFLVINGDIMTAIDPRRLLDFHRQHRCVMCIGAIRYRVSVPYGVLDLAGHYVLDIAEKPKQALFCNAGIYVLSPEILRFVTPNTACDMTKLLDKVVRNGLPVAAFPIHESWLDIGKIEDLKRARKAFKQKDKK